MSSNRIPPTPSVGDLVRILGSVGSGSGVARSGGADARGQRAATHAKAPEDLRSRLAKSLSGVDIDDPVAMKRARRIAVREILLWEFGDALHEDSEFNALQEAVDVMMQADAGSAERFAMMIKALRE